jgi:hypothetical protein
MTVFVPTFGALGALALLLVYIWLLSAIACSKLSELKGYGEKPGLGTGLILSAAGVIVWLLWPSKRDSRWRELFRRSRASTEG